MIEITLTLVPATLDWLILNTSNLGIAIGGLPARVVYAMLAALSVLLWRLKAISRCAGVVRGKSECPQSAEIQPGAVLHWQGE